MNVMNLVQKVKSKKVGALSLMALGAIAALPVSASAAPIDFATTTGIDVTPADVVSTGFSFANMFGPYTTLVLGIIFAPVGIGFIIWLWNKLPRLGKSGR